MTSTVPAPTGFTAVVTTGSEEVICNVTSQIQPEFCKIVFPLVVDPQGSKLSQSILKRKRYNPGAKSVGNVHDGIFSFVTPQSSSEACPLLLVPVDAPVDE